MKRLSSKDYEATLAVMRRWPDPYRSTMALIVHHLQWQANEIRKLEEEVRHFRQQSFLEEKKQLEATKAKPAPVGLLKEELEKWPLYKRLKFIFDTDGKDSTSWNQALKWNYITDEQALDLIRDYELSLDNPR